MRSHFMLAFPQLNGLEKDCRSISYLLPKSITPSFTSITEVEVIQKMNSIINAVFVDLKLANLPLGPQSRRDY